MLPKMNAYEFIQLLQIAKTDAVPVIQQLQQLDVAELSAIVSRELGEEVKVNTWQANLLGGLDSSLFAGGVYRVNGTAVTMDNRPRDWAVFAKNLRSPEGLPLPDGTTLSREYAEIQDAFIYWRREALVAESGLLAALPAGLAAPRYLGSTLVNDGEIFLWQEMLPPDDQTWTWSNYREAAYRLGRWQGKALISKSSSDQGHANMPWLTKNWLASWTENSLIYITDLIAGMNGWQNPLLVAHFTPDELSQLQQLWQERYKLLTQLSTLQQTLCHLDAHQTNMVWRDSDLLLLDWSYAGQAALGEELSAFVGATLWFDHLPLAGAERLETVVFDGYLAGLRAVDWDDDANLVWQAYRCHMPLRYTHNALLNMLRSAVDPGFAEEWEQKTNQPLADIQHHEANYIRFLLTRFSMALEAA